MKKKTCITMLFIIVASIILVPPAGAQEIDELELRLVRNRGFRLSVGRAIPMIGGSYSAQASGPDDLARVDFFIGDDLMGSVNEKPFNLRFITDDFPTGVHTFHATGFTSDGRQLHAVPVKAEIVTDTQRREILGQILLYVFIALITLTLITGLFPVISIRRKKKSLPMGAARDYGVFGGAICPNCKRPFSINYLSLVLIIGRLDRCPFCGKISFVKRTPIEQLKAAEAAELERIEDSQQDLGMSEEERLRKQLEASRFRDK